MAPIAVTYPHARETAVPEALPVRAIWSVAHAVRGQIVSEVMERKLPLDQLVEKTSGLVVNGVAFAVHWDLEHAITGKPAQPAMGATEYDPAEPGSIFVSVNGSLLRGHDELLRSTSAHELGHVVFDAPGWVRQGRGLRMISLATGTSMSLRRQSAQDASEQRANEFMGALLAPPALLRVDFQRLAKRHRFAAAAMPSRVLRGAPAYDGGMLDGDSVGEAMDRLADQYGLTEQFIRVRLARYDLLRPGRAL